MKKIVILLSLIFLVKIVTAQLSDSSKQYTPRISNEEFKSRIMLARLNNYDSMLGMPFGEFSIKDISGRAFSNKDLIGKITFINFWFNSCVPCHDEFDNLNQLYEHYKADSNFQFISLTFDGVDETIENIKKYNMPYRMFCVSNELCHQLMGIWHGFPANFIINRNGKIFLGYGGIYEGKDDLSKIFIPKLDSLLL